MRSYMRHISVIKYRFASKISVFIVCCLAQFGRHLRFAGQSNLTA